MLSLIIDRVRSINVFNLMENNVPSEESHLQSKIDDDLILEYVSEVDKLVRVSHAVLNNSNQHVNADVLKDLRVLGETFFHQFFPLQIMEKLRSTRQKSIHFNIDPSLALIPWDLLHDGNSFLCDRFYIGKTIRGGLHLSPDHGYEKIRMLIIADPTEDLPGAQREGEMLFSILSQRISSKRLELEFMGGKQVTKLKLLSHIKDKHIIHYSGHLYFSQDHLENGWLLSDDKVLKAREIKATGITTDLVFSNSCVSAKNSGPSLSPNLLNQYAGAFLSSGIKTFLGTNWEISDNERTIDFTIRFYSLLFGGKSVGESLYYAKEFARRNNEVNDLTWANYTLFGNPDYLITTKEKDKIQERKPFNPSLLQSFFPSPIVESYMDFLALAKSGATHKVQLISIIRVFEALSKVIGMLVFSDHMQNSMGKPIPNNPDDALTIRKWWELTFACLWDFQRLKINPFLQSIFPFVEDHREVILKIIHWMEDWGDSHLPKEEFESYLILFQFFIDNFFSDLSEFEKISFLLVSENSHYHYQFKGTKPGMTFLPANDPQEAWLTALSEHKGSLVAVHFQKKKILNYSALIQEKGENGSLHIHFPGFQPLAFDPIAK